MKRALALLKAEPDAGLAARALHVFAMGAMPVLLAALTLVSMIFWQDRYSPEDPAATSVKVLEAEPGQTPAGMLPLVDAVAPAPYVDTRLSTRPFWMLRRAFGWQEWLV